MIGGWLFSARLFSVGCEEARCIVEMENTPDSFHAYSVPEGVDIRPGDAVTIHNPPTVIGYGEKITQECRITVDRAGWLKRVWTQFAELFELTELYEVGFQPHEVGFQPRESP